MKITPVVRDIIAPAGLGLVAFALVVWDLPKPAHSVEGAVVVVSLAALAVIGAVTQAREILRHHTTTHA